MDTKEIQIVKIVADDNIPFLKSVLDGQCEVVYLPGEQIGRKDLEGADALIIRSRTRCNEALLKGTSVSFIATATIGFDHIDTAFCSKSGIEWSNAPGCNAGSVAQYLLSALLHLSAVLRLDLKDMTLGIVGVGHVGSRVAAIGRALGMKVLLNDPPRQRAGDTESFAGLEELITGSDIISLHVPLNMSGRDMTYHLVDDAFAEKLKKPAVLINTSRGEVADGGALKRAVNRGKLHYLVLDVWENEPHPDPGLMELTGIATPHIAGYSTDGKAKGTGMAVRAVSRFFGLGLDEWAPGELPEPKTINVKGSGRAPMDVLSEVVTCSYDIMKDHEALRSKPGDFERLRAAYPSRREPPPHRVRIEDGNSLQAALIRDLGFRIAEDPVAHLAPDHREILKS